MSDFNPKVGGLWEVIRSVEVPRQGKIGIGTYGIITKVEYVPFSRRGCTLVQDRWNISFLSPDKLFEIRRVSKHMWQFYFRSAEDNVDDT